MIDAIFTLETSAGRREVHLATYLTAEADERAAVESIHWIKSLRDARVDGVPLRRRFTYRGDSLWWFAEIYLHKQQAITTVFRALAALDALIDREQPRTLHFMRGSDIVRGLAPQVAAVRQVRYHGPQGFRRSSALALAAMEARSSALHTAARTSRRRGRGPAAPAVAPHAVAFVHRAFWRADGSDGSAESYIGAVLAALERKLGDPQRLAYVSVGPAANFRARRWWHPIAGAERSGAAVPIEAYVPRAALAGSREVWRERHVNRRALWKSADLRMRSVIQHCDCWPVVRDELAGIALLQWPWSARAMDEAAAVLDALQPRLAVTYAEAGGWGRAIVLECRRRGTPSIGLQHGFIYRHWLNYLHEPDEMMPDGSDRGFPTPTLTLLFDAYAARHLTDAGHFPAQALAVTGSPRLDALAAEAARLNAADVDAARTAAGAAGKSLVVVATKHREVSRLLPALLEAAAALPDVHLAIKAHPAEPADVYSIATGRAGVSVLESAAPLAPLLRACRAVVTVNSTLALDAAVLDVPALVVGLPNNLSPFVDAGILAGARDTTVAGLRQALEQILYHEGFRSALAGARRDFLAEYAIRADGRAAERSAAAILGAAGLSESNGAENP